MATSYLKQIWATLFEVPACQVCALLVDEADRQAAMNMLPAGVVEAYARILPNIRKAIHEHLKWQNFAEHKGGYFPQLAKAPEKFVLRRDAVRAWLERMRSADSKRLFLLTNSNWDYADLVMTTAFGSDWRNLFDLIVYRASKKGAFFDHKRPFKSFDKKLLSEGESTGNLREALESGCCEFVEGNAADISKLFGEDAGVMYFGDDLNGDVAVVHRFSPWRTVAVVEELSTHATATYWGPVLSFVTDEFEPHESCTLRTFNAEDTFGTPRASHILDMLASTADLTVPDLATIAECPTDHRFEHGDVVYGSVFGGNSRARTSVKRADWH